MGVRVDQVLKGDAPSSDIIVRSDGGRYLLTNIDVQPTVTFYKDTDPLLFLESANKRSDFRVVGSIQGNYRIEKNNAGVEIAVQQDSNTSIPLADLIDLIKIK